MKKENIKFFTGATLGLLIAVAGIATASNAYFGSNGMMKFNAEDKEAYTEALENRDYSAWQNIAENTRRAKNLSEDQFNDMADRHVAMKEAFENNDFEAWQELMADKGRVKDIITEENFTQFVQIHELMEAGDFEGAREIKEELGLGQGFKKGGRASKGMGRGMHQDRSFTDVNGDGVCDYLDVENQN